MQKRKSQHGERERDLRGRPDRHGDTQQGGGERWAEHYRRTHLGLALHYAKLIGILVGLFCSLLVAGLLVEVGGLAGLVGNALTTVLALATAVLGVAGSVLCCWVPPRSGARGLILASLACDGAALLLRGVSGVLWVAIAFGLPAPFLAAVGLQFLAVPCALAALVLFLLFLGQLARSVGERRLGKEAVALVIHLAIMVGGTFVGLFVLGSIAAAFAAFAARSAARGGLICPIPIGLLLVVAWLWYRWRDLNQSLPSHVLSLGDDARESRSRLAMPPALLLLAPLGAGVVVVGGISGVPAVRLALLAVGGLMILGLAAWLLVRGLEIIGSVRAALPTDGGDIGETIRTLPVWLWLAPPAAVTLVLGASLFLMVLGELGRRVPEPPPRTVAVNPPAPPPPQARPNNAPEPPRKEPPPPQAEPEAPRKTPPPATNFPGLIAYWPFDDDTNPTERVADRSPNGNHGKAVGATRVDGVRGKALAFANQGYFDYGTGTALNFPANGAFTLACWVKTTAAAGTLISQRHSKDDGADIDLFLSGGRVQAHVRQDRGFAHVGIEGPAAVNDDTWHHAALLRSGQTVELYVDGALAGRGSGNEAGGAITTDLRAVGREGRWYATGRRDAGVFFTGAVDEVCVFNRTLTPEEIQALAGR
jgi:hypothetical protein